MSLDMVLVGWIGLMIQGSMESNHGGVVVEMVLTCVSTPRPRIQCSGTIKDDGAMFEFDSTLAYSTISLNREDDSFSTCRLTIPINHTLLESDQIHDPLMISSLHN